MRIVLVALLMWLVSGVASANLEVYTTWPAQVYVRPSRSGGAAEYVLKAPTTPASIKIDNQDYDVMVWTRLSTFKIARGEQLKIPYGSTVTVPMTIEWDVARLSILGLLAMGVLAFAVGRALAPVVRQMVTPQPSLENAALAPGTVVSRYRVISLIGQGGMGNVYEVEDVEHLDRFAMKVPSRGLDEGSHLRERFRRELEITKKLYHPNIVRIFDYDISKDLPVPYIIMELIHGVSWAQQLDRGPCSMEQAARILIAVLRALAYGHQRGIVHRDVKPGNILIDQVGVARLSDYGIARSEAMQSITQTMSPIGTPQYMAPEQFDNQPVDPRMDVYAAGTMLFYALTARLPFDAENAYAMLLQKSVMDAPAPSTIKSDIPNRMDEIVLKAIARNPGDRYQTADAFREDLEAFLAQ